MTVEHLTLHYGMNSGENLDKEELAKWKRVMGYFHQIKVRVHGNDNLHAQLWIVTEVNGMRRDHGEYGGRQGMQLRMEGGGSLSLVEVTDQIVKIKIAVPD